MTTLKARFDGRVLIPEQPVDLPVGCVFDVELRVATPPAAAERPLAALVDLAETFPDTADAPADGAAQHDHYLYGTPKRP